MKKYFMYAIFLTIPPIVRPIGFAPIQYERPPLHFLTDVCAAGVICFLVCKLFKTYRIPISSKLAMFAFGVLLGLVMRYTESRVIHNYVHLLYRARPSSILYTVLPILMFKIAFSIDAHTFKRAWLQILIISVPGVAISTVFVGFLGMAILNHKWRWMLSRAMAFGVCCTPIYPEEVVKLLKEIDKAKHLDVLLEGEAIIGTTTAVVVFRILAGNIEGYITHWYQFIAVFARLIAGGIVVGIIVGKLVCSMVSMHYNDAMGMMSITVVASCFSFYICQDILSVSGVICVAIIGTMLSIERARLSTEVEEYLIANWEFMAYMLDNILFGVYGIISIKIFMDHASLSDYALVLVTYVLVNTGRFLTFIVLAPILSRVGYGLTFRNLAVAAWGGLKGSVTICTTLIVYTHPEFETMAKDLFIHMTGLVIITLFINSSSMNMVLHVLGFLDLSMPRRTNMNNCVRLVRDRRERTIGLMRMDRYLGDANWDLVEEMTEFRHPYQIVAKDGMEDDFFMGYRFTVCPDCQKELAAAPSAKELAEMTREARIRVLKAKKISYTRQYEEGMLSKDAFRILIQAVELTMDSSDVLLDVDGLVNLFRHRGCIHYIRKRLLRVYYNKDQDEVKPPRRRWRRCCYRIIMHKAFEPVIYSVIVLNIAPLIVEVITKPSPISNMGLALFACNTFFFLVYLFEFYLKVYGHAYIYLWKDGVKTYFRSSWNIFDFIILVITTADFTMDLVDLMPMVNFNKANSNIGTITMVARMLRLLRLLRLVKLCRSSFPSLIKCVDAELDKKLKHAYDLGRGFTTAEQEVSEKLFNMIDNASIREETRLRMETDKLTITYELGMVQREKQYIAITLKTRQAIMAVLNSMSETIYELRMSGWVDDVEFSKLMEVVNSRYKAVRHLPKIHPRSPDELFKEVPWIDEEDIIQFLFANVRTKVFDPGDVICRKGEILDGVYIILTGLFMQSYRPEPFSLNRLREYGELPIVDYITTIHFELKFDDIISSGNSIGEMGVLTNRPYSCTVTAATPSQAFVLSREVMKVALERSAKPVQNLSSRMWKFVLMKLATAVLMEVPAYMTMRKQKIRYILERSFVPDLTRFKVFAVNEMIEDMLLLEGAIIDFNTYDTYVAPCYVPRTVLRIQVIHPTKSQTGIVPDAKVMIIPIQDVEDYEVMEMSEEMSEMMPNASSIAQAMKKSKARKRRKRKRAMLQHRKMLAAEANTLSTMSLVDARKSCAVFGTISYASMGGSLDKSFCSSYTERSFKVSTSDHYV